MTVKNTCKTLPLANTHAVNHSEEVRSLKISDLRAFKYFSQLEIKLAKRNELSKQSVFTESLTHSTIDSRIYSCIDSRMDSRMDSRINSQHVNAIFLQPAPFNASNIVIKNMRYTAAKYSLALGQLPVALFFSPSKANFCLSTGHNPFIGAIMQLIALLNSWSPSHSRLYTARLTIAGD